MQRSADAQKLGESVAMKVSALVFWVQPLVLQRTCLGEACLGALWGILCGETHLSSHLESDTLTRLGTEPPTAKAFRHLPGSASSSALA